MGKKHLLKLPKPEKEMILITTKPIMKIQIQKLNPYFRKI